MYDASFNPDHEAQVGTALARRKTLVQFSYFRGTSPSFCEKFCDELSKNFDTKLEWLKLIHTTQFELCYDGIPGHGHASGVDATTLAKIRKLLE